ncbi:HU family DNA-binding protein [Candidatus Berkiella cookevillensis]|uniref:Bacterial DNA-binding protein n=1 Tax=Candidatus Berkiella cookevillensis TaxID=437022 RepID=A0A0Q9YQ47_9GAMM|nr:HU family DNA-binding protein [Candidatus Berkiella cookevillensis]MCS5709713.1 HU family DNA-binding protein [Candidatus Berkiella cookevillensis]
MSLKKSTKTSMKKNIQSAQFKEKTRAIKERQSRAEIFQHIANETGIKRIDVEAVFDVMAKLVKSHLAKKGSGEIIIPKLGLKIRKVRRKATKERTMISPLTGSEVVIPSKPARDDVKLVVLKPLKEAVLS